MDKGVTKIFDKQRALFDAAKNGRIEDVRKYLNNDTVDFNSKDCDVHTALHLACYYSHLEIVELLLNLGADIEVRMERLDETPLLLACKQGHLSIIKLLLDRGTNIDACNKYCSNPLHKACRSGQASTAKLLLDRGSAVHAVDDYGDTPLHVACWKGNIGCVTEILAHGADVTTNNKHGHNPLGVARTRNQHSIIDILLNSKRDKCQRQHVIGFVRDGKESIMTEMNVVLKAGVADFVAKVSSMEGRMSSMEGRMSSMEGHLSSVIETIERLQSMQNKKESTIVAEMKAEVSSMEERLASRFEALSNRQSYKRLMKEETEINRSFKRGYEPTTSTVSSSNVEVLAEKEDTNISHDKMPMFSMFYSFRKN